jgi:predicted kinase
MRSVLTVVGGLPATGKSTLAALLAAQTRTPYLRVDRIEQAVVDWTTLVHPVGPVGYAVAHALVAEQLGLGLDVIVECVNPSAITRDGWRRRTPAWWRWRPSAPTSPSTAVGWRTVPPTSRA